ncbi:hypothetical protein KCU88_g1625, partial [Aureobasidium melanogenum]
MAETTVAKAVLDCKEAIDDVASRIGQLHSLGLELQGYEAAVPPYMGAVNDSLQELREKLQNIGNTDAKLRETEVLLRNNEQAHNQLVQQKDTEIAKLKEELSSEKQAIGQLQEQLSQVHDDLSKRTKAFEELEHKYSEQTRQRETEGLSWNESSSNDKREIEQLKGQLSKTKANLLERSNAFEKLKNELSEEAHRRAAEGLSWKESSSQDKREIEQLQGKLSKTNDDLLQRDDTIKKLEHARVEERREKEKHAQNEVQALQDKERIELLLTTAQEEVTRYRQDLSEKNKELEAAKQKLEAVKKNSTKKDEMLVSVQQTVVQKNEELSRREEELETLQQSLSATQKGLINTNAQLSEREDKLVAVRQKLADEKTQLVEKEGELLAAQKSLKDTNARLAELSDTLLRKNNDLDSIHQKLADVEAVLSTVRNELSASEQKLQDTKTAVADLKQNVSQKEEELSAKNATLETIRNELEKSKGLIDAKDQELSTATGEQQRMTEKAASLEAELSQMKASASLSDARILKLEDTIGLMKTELTAKENTLAQAADAAVRGQNAADADRRRRNLKLKRVREDLGFKILFQQEETSRTINRMELEQAELERLIAELHQSAQELQDVQVAEKARLELALSEARGELTREREEHDGQREELGESLRQSQHDREALQGRLDEYATKHHQIRHNQEMLGQQLSDLREEHASHLKELESLRRGQKDQAILQQQLKDVRAENASHLEELEKMRQGQKDQGDLVNMQAQVDRARQQLGEVLRDVYHDNMHGDLLTQHAEENNTADEHATALQDKQRQIDELRADLQSLRAQFQEPRVHHGSPGQGSNEDPSMDENIDTHTSNDDSDPWEEVCARITSLEAKVNHMQNALSSEQQQPSRKRGRSSSEELGAGLAIRKMRRRPSDEESIHSESGFHDYGSEHSSAAPSGADGVVADSMSPEAGPAHGSNMDDVSSPETSGPSGVAGAPITPPNSASQKARQLRRLFFLAWDYTPEEDAAILTYFESMFQKGKPFTAAVEAIDRYCIGSFLRENPCPRPCLMAKLLSKKAGNRHETMPQARCPYCGPRKQICLWAKHAPDVATGFGRRVNGAIEAENNGRNYDPTKQQDTVRLGGYNVRWILKKRRANMKEPAETLYGVDNVLI